MMIRDASESDIETIVAIYNAAIPGRLATADTEPVSVEARLGWFRDRDHSRHPIWVAESEGRVVGWLSFGKFYGRPAYSSTAELSVYVDPNAQRRGIATQLVGSACAGADRFGLKTLLGFVFAHNERSVSLCRKFGFDEWGRLPRVAVLDSVERDLLIMGRRLKGQGLPNQSLQSDEGVGRSAPSGLRR
jgi:L-amino acid N-acyltransferase YncA